MRVSKKRAAIAVVLALLAVVGAAHLYFSDRGRFTTVPEYSGLARSTAGQDLLSPADPAIALRFDPDFRHIGGHKFILYGVADTEQHFFVETRGDDLHALYWIQFEAYLPDNSYTYDYEDSPGRVELGGLEFYLDTAIVESDPSKRRRGTDGSLARAFALSKGYEFPQDFIYARLVHLTDESRRKELMIIYIEDLAPSGLTASGLDEGGADAARWPEVERQMLERIRNTLTPMAL